MDYLNSWSDLLINLVESIYWIILIGVIIGVLQDNKNPIKTISWLLVLSLLPIFGLIIYLFFGQNYRKQKLISKKSIKKFKNNPVYLYDELNPSDFPCEYSNTMKLLRNNNFHHVFTDNSIVFFNNGKDKFDSLIKDLKEAKRYIHLEYYIFMDDKIGTLIKNILIEKAKEGIEIKLIYDDLGCFKTKKKFFKEMREVGITIHPFIKVILPFLSLKTNYRNHRKIAIIDGNIGYVGGMNIADRYINGADFAFWRDAHIRIEGKGVYGLQTIFAIDWFFVCKENITSKFYYPNISYKPGNITIQTATSGPDSDWRVLEQAIIQIIANAKHYVYLQTPYFLPSESFLMALQTSALAGVDIRLMIPKNSDSKITTKAMDSYLTEVMEAGVRVYFFETGFIHSKTVVVDDNITSIGSANLDYRSFELNFEVNSFIYNKEFAKYFKTSFIKDIETCSEIDFNIWKDRSKFTKGTESICRIFGPML